eukprot:gene10365-21625_t
MKSAYFPEDSQSLVVESKSPDKKVSSYDLSSRYIEFPISRSVLWDHRPAGAPLCYNAREKLPPLFIPASIIQNVIREFISAPSQPVDYNVLLCNLKSLTDREKDAVTNWPGRKSKQSSYILRMSNFHQSQRNSNDSDFTLKIPISYCNPTDRDLIFPNTSTRNLLENLQKSISSSRREFSLKSSIRIRACGTIRQLSHKKPIATLRFEAILPDITFKFQPINPIPILDTTLHSHISNYQNSNNNNNNNNAVYDIGYITLNQTRKIVLLLVSDPAVASTPLVGLWIHIANTMPNDTTTSTALNPIHDILEHPFIWTSCTRFHYSIANAARNRNRNSNNNNNNKSLGDIDVVFADENQKTFLLVLFSDTMETIFVE